MRKTVHHLQIWPTSSCLKVWYKVRCRWPVNFILTWRRGRRDQQGGSLRMRPRHCTPLGLRPAISPNVGNSGAEFLVVGVRVRAAPDKTNKEKSLSRSCFFHLQRQCLLRVFCSFSSCSARFLSVLGLFFFLVFVVVVVVVVVVVILLWKPYRPRAHYRESKL